MSTLWFSEPGFKITSAPTKYHVTKTKTIPPPDDAFVQRIHNRVEFYSHLDPYTITRVILCKRALLKIGPCIKYVQSKQKEDKTLHEKTIYIAKEKKLKQVQTDLKHRLAILNARTNVSRGILCKF